jgi:hypothetical protein
MGTIDNFDNGVFGFIKLYFNYEDQNCSEKLNDTKNNFVLNGLEANDFVGNSLPTSPISTNCKVLNDSLLAYATNINTARKTIQLSTNDTAKTGYSADPKFTDYIADSVKLKTNYQKLVNQRQELDMNMQQLLGYDNSLLYEKQGVIDSSVYTTLLWTVLATSVLYYTFTKL